MSVLMRIEQFLRAQNMAPTRFGRTVARDPRLVFDMRRGRQLQPPLLAVVLAFIEQTR